MRFLVIFFVIILISCSSSNDFVTTGALYYYTLLLLDSILIPNLNSLNYVESRGTKLCYKKYFYLQGDSILYNIELINDSIYETNKIRIK